MLTLSMFININTSKKRSRIARNLESVHVHLTDLQALFSRKRNLERKNVILFFSTYFSTRQRVPRFSETPCILTRFFYLCYIFIFLSFYFRLFCFTFITFTAVTTFLPRTIRLVLVIC